MNKCTVLGIFAINFKSIAVLKVFCAKKLCSVAAITIAALGIPNAHSQAPIRDRSEAATPVEGARRAADVAGHALTAAESRAKIAAERRKKAEAALVEANNEMEAARREANAATSEVAKTRKADAEARAALAKLLEARK